MAVYSLVPFISILDDVPNFHFANLMKIYYVVNMKYQACIQTVSVSECY